MEDNLMKRLTIAAASLLLIAACTHSPTGFAESTSQPSGTLSLQVGPEAETILNAGSASQASALAAAAWEEQLSYDVPKEAEKAAEIVSRLIPEVVEITQSRLTPLTSAAGKAIPSTVSYPDFAPVLIEALAAKGFDYRIHESEITVDCTVPMAVDGQADIYMNLTVTEVIVTPSAKWLP